MRIQGTYLFLLNENDIRFQDDNSVTILRIANNDIIPLIDDFIKLLAKKINSKFGVVTIEAIYDDPPSKYIIGGTIYYTVEGESNREISLPRKVFLDSNSRADAIANLKDAREKDIMSEIETEKNSLGIQTYRDEIEKIITQ